VATGRGGAEVDWREVGGGSTIETEMGSGGGSTEENINAETEEKVKRCWMGREEG